MITPDDIVRVVVFVVVFTLMTAWEWRAPRRLQSLVRATRWRANLGLAVFNVVLLRMITPVTLLGMAQLAYVNGWGLFNVLGVPVAPAAVVSFVALDLTIFTQHVVFHRAGWLWRLHRVHHADVAFDATTGLRFHPGEAVVSLAVKMAAVLALGAPVVAVLCFEVVLNASSLFNHSNVRLPLAVDALLRRVVVTPDMHRVHHSAVPVELNSNFGFNFAW